MSKLHFLFIMLNISQVNVVKKGILAGIITKLEFVKKRKDELKIKRREERNQRKMQGALYTEINAPPTPRRSGVSINEGILDRTPAAPPTIQTE